MAIYEPRKKKEDELGTGEPSDPSIVTIGGIRHDVSRPSPVQFNPGAVLGETAKVIGGGVVGGLSAMGSAMTPSRVNVSPNRDGLETAPATNPGGGTSVGSKPASMGGSPAISSPITQQAISSGIDINAMGAQQRGAAAEAFRDGIDRATDVSSTGAGGFTGMAKRLSAYAKNPDILAMRNAREDLLGSGIRLEQDGHGGITITDGGDRSKPLPTAGGSIAQMSEGLQRLANANAINQSMIDSRRTDTLPSGGVAGLGDPNAQERENAEKTARWAADSNVDAIRRTGASARDQAQAIATLLSHQAEAASRRYGYDTQLQGAALSNQSQLRGQDIGAETQRRGQDINAQTAIAQLNGNPLDQKAKQMDLDTRTRLATLQADYLNETDPAKKQSIAESIRVLSGKEKASNFKAVHAAGGTYLDPSNPTQPLKTPDSVLLYNEQTGQTQAIPAGGAQVAQAAKAPAVGEIRGGYKFNGGDPSKQSSWEKV